MRIPLFGLLVLPLVGCLVSDEAVTETSQLSGSSTTLPTSTGRFLGHYNVPTTADLAIASNFAMPKVEWTCSSGVATLHYDLPVGLVGGDVEVTLSGPMPSGATSVQLSGLNGGGTCTASGTKVTCSESLANLGALPVSMAVVDQTAIANSVPVAAARSVAGGFSTDPIGTIDFDVSKPVDGGGGGRGPH